MAKTEVKNKVILSGVNDISIFRSAVSGTAFRYSEILSNVSERRVNLKSLTTSSDIEIDVRIHPYAIILTPDCDLDWDFNTRFDADGKPQSHTEFNGKEIPTILLCEVIEAQMLKAKYDLNSKTWPIVRKNNNQRYHFFSSIEPENDFHEEGLPELAIDFKRYFTIPTAELYWQIESENCKRHSWLSCAYLEHLSHRFGNFISRVALPAYSGRT